MGILVGGGDGRGTSSDDKDDGLVSESSDSVWGDGRGNLPKGSGMILEWRP